MINNKKPFNTIKKIEVKNLNFDKNTEANVLCFAKNANPPKVSVIIPVFNIAEYLPQCLESLLQQSLSDFEIIAVDDGSSDSSLDILMSYAEKDNRITVISQNNNFAGVARNAGLKIASGKYVIFLDGDDFFEKNLLEKASSVLESENSDLVFFQYKYFNVQTNTDEPNSRGINKKFDTKGRDYVTVQTSALKEGIFTFANPMPWNKMLRMEFIRKNNLLFQNLLLSNDVYFSFTSIVQSSRISILYQPLVHYRYNNSSSLRNKRDEHPFCFYECFCKLHDYLVEKKLWDKDIKKAFLNSLVSSIIFTIDNTFYKKNEVKLFAKHTIIPQFFKSQDDYSLLKSNYLKDLEARGLTNSELPDVIVSLTTYPARIKTISQTIKTIIDQTYPYKLLVLWLAPSQFPNKEKDLPNELVEMIKRKTIQVCWYHDIRSYKKLIPSLKKYPNDAIVTVDDDLLYPKDLLQRLVNAYHSAPNMIHTLRAHGVIINSLFEFLPYRSWKNPLNESTPSFFNFLTGGAGCLYPPNTLSKIVFKEKQIKNLCPLADDIWFWASAVANDIKINLVTPTIGQLKYVPNSQDTDSTLWRTNVLQGANDEQLHCVLKKYPNVFRNMMKELTNAKVINNSFRFMVTIQKGHFNSYEYKNIKFLGINCYTLFESNTCKVINCMGFKLKLAK